MSIPCPGLSAGFMQIGISAFTMHDQALPPPVPLKCIPGLIEGPAFMGWPPGKLTHKAGTKTQFDGNFAIQYGHDIGFVIPHFAIPMNALCAIHTAFSKHKVAFPISNVLIEGKPLGTYSLAFLGIICAAPVSLPTGVVILLKCTVVTSMGVADFLLGLLTIAIDVVFDLAWNKIKGKFPKWGDNLAKAAGQQAISQIILGGGAALAGKYVLAKLGEKGLQWVVKNWVLSPAVKWFPLWGIGQIPGTPEWMGEQRPGLGSGNWGPKFFKSDPNEKGGGYGVT